ncbi:DNA-binding transcriptional regulator, XRE-family HTH domain [Micromonospora pallida]|uniref:DNA-binding transcriptional regulator, XRE-family HTH domain n=1 Tax=Micromonospora pallida TaxID=145854 RepID=A0A1C6RHI7_9ACTN|nr:helix-turn-helix transcriptional regulator [Micromonospora pallida]SCL16509.1 DNA-binding transcriptional regulator, XRE-family HTH domain [Micromonospora pallida]SCL16995.1 DNA-binding transcriptional regulator, XRE-family HTH domain [Micromonospora pallida]SCL43353.1 DNA-binding transcriptional regulator, XRE-family HTH domain [Micromonospora pallida]
MSWGYVRIVRTCYNLHMSERGVAYAFWLRVRSEQATRGWTDDELKERSGIARTTIDRLAKGKRPPLARVVNSLAKALDIDNDEAHRLAGRLPGEPDQAEGEPSPAERRISAREAVLNDPDLNDQQRAVILGVIDLITGGGGEDQGRQAS